MPKNQIEAEIEYVLSAALKRCGNLHDAEDLTQETILSALLYLEKGGMIDHPRTFLSVLLNRKYYDMLRRKYRIPTVSIGDDFDIIDDADFSEDFSRREEAEQIRREVAFLTESYRAVIVNYYFYNQNLHEISEKLGLPLTTIKSRLDFGRKQMKKGFEKMENYQENSYMPQWLAVHCSGRFGMNGEPMSLTDGDTLAQNLLILAYEKPISISDLSKAIGVAAAYTEPVINKLVAGELMKRRGDGKVYTDFIIYHASDHVKYVHEAEAFVEEHIEAYTDPLKIAIKELKETSFYSQRLERFMMLQIAEGLFECMESIRKKPVIWPDRPNGGKWIASATIHPQNYSIPEDKRGKEDYTLAGRRYTGIDSYLDAKNLKLYNFESSLDPTSWMKHHGYGFHSFQELENNMLKFFYLVKNNINPQNVDLDARMINAIPILEERGFITTQNGYPEVLIPILSHKEEKTYLSICNKAQKAFGENIRPYLALWCKTHIKEIPPHLTSVPDQKRTFPYEPNVMMFVYEAIHQGVHPRDLGYICPETIAVFD